MNKEEKLMLRELYSSANANQRLLLEKLFPTLKESESEDEWIRKWIIDDIRYNINNESLNSSEYKKQGEKAIAWLEKQGDQNLLARQYLVSKGYPVNTSGNIPTYDELYEIIKDGIMDVDKVEPKFNIGDWITDNNSTFQIVRVENEWYYADDGDKICFDVAHQYYHLWTIEDAKDGDVLAYMEQLFLFKRMNTLNSFCSHCSYHFIGYDSLSVYDCSYSIDNIYPATKEQSDLLFQKIKEAGYKWKNNKLEKINANWDYVDLGLPSGTLWAKCNLGAEKETDFGLFFQWGDTQGYEGVDKHRFNWADYKWETENNITKYNDLDNKLVLDNEDDPVFVATNGMFKSPTKEQMQELIDHTDHKWTTIDGVNGMKFINKKDDTKYIFIPAAGYCTGGHYNNKKDDTKYIFIPAPGYCTGGHYNVGSWGYVWSVSSKVSNENDAWSMYVNAGNVGIYSNYRCIGYSVRGILNK